MQRSIPAGRTDGQNPPVRTANGHNTTNLARHILLWLDDQRARFDAGHDCCLLRDFQSATGCEDPLLEALVHDGFTLRRSWPRPWHSIAKSWIGARYYLGHQEVLTSSRPLVAVASSRIGRSGHLLSDWPRRLDGTLRILLKSRQRLLLVPGTTLFQHSLEIASVSNIDYLIADVETEKVSTQDWLANSLAATGATRSSRRNAVRISPPCNSDALLASALPLQDLVAFALADQIRVLSAAPRGTVDQLCRLRLCCSDFATGSLWIDVPSETPTRHLRRLKKNARNLMKDGAIGYYRPFESTPEVVAHCRGTTAGERRGQALLQISCSLASQRTTSPYLHHCTRGGQGLLPNESTRNYRLRTWMEGKSTTEHPFASLWKILRSGRLVAGSRLLRTSTRCVSFSETPLSELLIKRSFQSHLGRWDWEPYGVSISQSYLQRLGARPVIYGDDSDYQELPEETRPYFQARGENARWESEREWRVIGDVDLSSLPPEAVRIFVRTRVEAAHVARSFGWFVSWIE